MSRVTVVECAMVVPVGVVAVPVTVMVKGVAPRSGRIYKSGLQPSVR